MVTRALTFLSILFLFLLGSRLVAQSTYGTILGTANDVSRGSSPNRLGDSNGLKHQHRKNDEYRRSRGL